MSPITIYSRISYRIFVFPWLFWGTVIGYCTYRSADGVLFRFVSEFGAIILLVISLMTFIRGMKERTEIGEAVVTKAGLRVRMGEEETEIPRADLSRISIRRVKRSVRRIVLPSEFIKAGVITWSQADLGTLLREIEAAHGPGVLQEGKEFGS